MQCPPVDDVGDGRGGDGRIILDIGVDHE
jgi:hypothetical protein